MTTNGPPGATIAYAQNWHTEPKLRKGQRRSPRTWKERSESYRRRSSKRRQLARHVHPTERLPTAHLSKAKPISEIYVRDRARQIPLPFTSIEPAPSSAATSRTLTTVLQMKMSDTTANPICARGQHELGPRPPVPNSIHPMEHSHGKTPGSGAAAGPSCRRSSRS